MPTKRIDVHTHLVPPFWAAGLKTHGGDPSGWNSPDWSPESALRFMDDQEIALSVLSLTAPGVEGWKDNDRLDMTRRVNDYGAELVRRNPDRFGYFATLSLPDVEAALGEIACAYDELNVDGVVLHSNYESIYLGDPQFDPVWKELERRSATIFIHPTTPPMPIVPGLPGPLSDYPAETTRCALDLVLKGHRRRYASTKVILSHGGGFLPYASTRFAELSALVSNELSADELRAEMQSFYFDTALVAPSGLPSLLAFAPIDHIVFGTDFPYASEKVSKTFTDHLDRAPELTTAQLEAVNCGAVRLLSSRQRSWRG